MTADQKIELSILIPIHEYGVLQKKMIESLVNQDSNKFRLYLGFNGLPEKDYKSFKNEILNKIGCRFPIETFCFSLGDANVTRQELYNQSSVDVEHIMFMDSDDRFSCSTAVSELLELKNRFNPDILCSNITTISNDEIKIFFKDRLEFKNANRLLNKQKNYMEIVADYRSNIVGKIIKRNLLENIVFKSLPMYQDWNITSKLFDRFDTIYNCDKAYYYYIYNENSISKKLKKNKINLVTECIKDINENIDSSSFKSYVNISFWLSILNFCNKTKYYTPFFKNYFYILKNINPFHKISFKHRLKYILVVIPIIGIPILNIVSSE